MSSKRKASRRSTRPKRRAAGVTTKGRLKRGFRYARGGRVVKAKAKKGRK